MTLHWLLTFAGLDGGRWAAFWGGIGSCLSEFAILGLVWRKVNCHAKGCLRVGLHRVDGTPYITCKKHHPVHPDSHAFTAEQIAEAHRVAVSVRSDPLGPVPSSDQPVPL